MALDGRYVINGDGVLSPPGTYEAAGTRVVYTRGVGPEETLQASGPTSQELLLQVGGSGRFEAGHWSRLTGEARGSREERATTSRAPSRSRCCCGSPTQEYTSSSGCPGSAMVPSRLRRRPWAGPCDSLSPGRCSLNLPRPLWSPRPSLPGLHPWHQVRWGQRGRGQAGSKSGLCPSQHPHPPPHRRPLRALP